MILYHNPRCSKSRQALTLLEEAGHAPTIVRYLDAPLDAQELSALNGMLGLDGPRAMMRTKEALYRELALADASDAALYAAMAAHPKLMERPILVAGKRAVIGRPPENVLDLVKDLG